MANFQALCKKKRKKSQNKKKFVWLSNQLNLLNHNRKLENLKKVEKEKFCEST
jgi:hypothetical protein